MRPYANRLQWNLKARSYHLIDGLAPLVDRLPRGSQQRFHRLSADLRRTLKAKLAFMVLLYIGIATSAVAWITQYVAAAEALLDVLRPLSGVLGGISIVFLGLYLLLQRRIGQLEADLVAICLVDS